VSHASRRLASPPAGDDLVAPSSSASADAGLEASRQRALDGYHIVDSLPEGVYDDIVHVAAALCGTPIALVSLIDRDRQWFKARTGLDDASTARDIAVCDHAIRNKDELFEIADLSRDARFAANPLVAGDGGMRFYAGMPLVTPDGHAIGTVCVIDHQPRALNEAQRSALRALARITMGLMEERARHRSLQQQAMEAARQATRTAPAAGGDGKGGFVAIIVELQDHAGLVRREGAAAVEQSLLSLEESLALLLPAGCAAAISRTPGSPECTLVCDAAGNGDILQRVEAFVARHAGATGARILVGAAESRRADEPLDEVFLRADDALSLAKDALRG
jgi:hypothetical protein